MRDEQASVNQEGKDNSLTALQKDQNLLNPVKVQPRQKSTKSENYTPQAPDTRYRYRYYTFINTSYIIHCSNNHFSAGFIISAATRRR